MALLYKADRARGLEWRAILAERAPDLDFRLWPEVGDPAAIRYLAAWLPPDDLAARFPNLEVVISVGAGVDQFDMAGLPPHIPLVRTLDPGIIASMVEYVTLGVLALHRHLPGYVADKAARRWAPVRVVAASARRIGVLGAGQLGAAACRALAGFGFPVGCWSRSPRRLEGATHFSGADGLAQMLARSDILVCLLPLTRQTRGLLNRDLFAQLPDGAGLVNAGRGGHLAQDDLLAALEAGKISAAFLDVTDPEPLAPAHPLWAHPRVMITPHVASMTAPAAAVDFALETIDNLRRGQPLRGLVDRRRGY